MHNKKSDQKPALEPRLNLRRETVRRLDVLGAEDLVLVAGGTRSAGRKVDEIDPPPPPVDLSLAD